MKSLKKNQDKDHNKEHIFEVDVEYPKRFHNLQNDLSFSLERMKIEKCSMHVCNL